MQEFGGIGAFVAGKEWVENKCHTYLLEASPHDPHLEAETYIRMVRDITAWRVDTSVVLYTQISDVEL